MKSKEYSKQFLRTVFAFFFVLILRTMCYAELSIESYCQLTVQSAGQEIGNLSELIVLAQSYCDPNASSGQPEEPGAPNELVEPADQSDDPNGFEAVEKAKRAEFDGRTKALFGSFDTTSGEYMAFMAKNKRAVEDYLNNHADIKQAIVELSSQIHALLEQYELLREAIIPREQVGP